MSTHKEYDKLPIENANTYSTYTEITDNATPSSTFYSRNRGAICMGLSSYALSFMHLGTKLLAEDNIPVAEMILIRSIGSTIACYILSNKLDLPGGFLGPREVRLLLLLRAILGGIGLAAFMAAVTYLHLGDVVTLSFVAPILMVLLAPVMLNEKFHISDLTCILLGVAGVILVSQPESIFGRGNDNEGGLSNGQDVFVGQALALIGALANSVGNVLVRSIGRRAHYVHIVSYFSLVPIVPSLVACAINSSSLVWHPGMRGWWNLFIMSAGGVFGQFFFSYSLQVDTVGKVTPMIFLQVVFAFINDWVLFQFPPSIWTLAGASLVGVSVYIANTSR